MPKVKETQKQATGSMAKNMEVPCCPGLDKDKGCDYLDFHYRLVQQKTILVEKKEYTIPVEILIKARLQRCTGKIALGDLVYSTTLFPGEKVRLFTMDRRSKFSYDSESELSYRQEQASEERYYMASMSHFMSDLSVRDSSTASSLDTNTFNGNGSTSSILGSIFSRPDIDVKGTHSASSVHSFLHELKHHAEASHNSSVEATRTQNSVSIGEVQSRTHKEGETENHFESSSRLFSNPNKCHALTYLFYQLNKTQTIRFEIVAIKRRVVDPAGNTRVSTLPVKPTGGVSVIPNSILATNKERLSTEEMARQSVEQEAKFTIHTMPQIVVRQNMASNPQIYPIQQTPIPDYLQERALLAVGEDLAQTGLVDGKTYEMTPESRREFSFEFKTSIPTAGVIVKSCLDDCEACESNRQTEIELEVNRKTLENALLEKQIELLEKSQEYRCCPEVNSEENVDIT